ncbi:melanocyte-stimulating hormone receptor-like [Actinia tenebrosa]|uniref:Melanocyte-stimulating hormone receptor-like n=1 Tax=Actinia tenebrosa TaxID=6105 RepID=A0A6P8IZP3_ACTTE|nr:melanocyte-stimulating hormone receptor-like [Actinia tenebrosa]XP_031573016.1 melanocyte-stimulating hormone receptor-like [Actinia tenebrosa]
MDGNQSDLCHCVDWEKSYDPAPVHQVYWSYIFTCVVTVTLSMTTTILNTLVIAAIYQTKSLHTPSNILLCSLAMSDLIVGFLAQPLYTTAIIMEIKGDVKVYCVTGAVTAFVSYTSAGASLFTLAAISVDRYFAIHRPLRYRAVVTPSAVAMVALALWIMGATGASTRLYLSVTHFMFSLALVMLISLITIFSANLKAFRSLKAQKALIIQKMQLHRGQEEVKLAQSRKYLVTMLYILGLVLLCYVPFVSVTLVTAMYGVTSSTRAAWNIADTIGYMNSTLNPFLYCLRMREISNAVRKILRKYCCRHFRNNQVELVKPVSQGTVKRSKKELSTIYEEPQISMTIA